MDRVRPVTGAVGALITAGLLAACGGEDNPISRDDTDRPLASSSSSPAPTDAASAAPSSSPSVSAGAPTSATPTVGAPLGSTPTGVLVQGTGFTIRLPGEPEKSSESAEGGITFDIYRYETDTATYTVTRGSYPKLGTLPTLHDAITSAAGQADGKLTDVHELKYRHEPGIEGVITGVKLNGRLGGEDVTIFARYVVVDRVMYGLLYLDKGASPTMTSAFHEFAESLTF